MLEYRGHPSEAAADVSSRQLAWSCDPSTIYGYRFRTQRTGQNLEAVAVPLAALTTTVDSHGCMLAPEMRTCAVEWHSLVAHPCCILQPTAPSCTHTCISNHAGSA